MSKIQGIQRLLIIDQSLTDADKTINIVRGAGLAVRASQTDKFSQLQSMLAGQQWDLIFCSSQLQDFSVFDVLRLLAEKNLDIPCIVLTADNVIDPELYQYAISDAVAIDDVDRLQFVARREIRHLQQRRLSRHNERALRECEKYTNRLLSATSEPLAFLVDGIHIYANHAYLHVLGFEDFSAVEDVPVLDLIPASQHNDFKKVFRQYTADPEKTASWHQFNLFQADGAVTKTQIEFSNGHFSGQACLQIKLQAKASSANAMREVFIAEDTDLLSGCLTRSAFVFSLQKIINTESGLSEGQHAVMAFRITSADQSDIDAELSDPNLVAGIGDTLRKNLSGNTVCGRVAENIFAVIFLATQQPLMETASVLLAQLKSLLPHQTKSHIYLGIDVVTEQTTSAEQLLENACSVAVPDNETTTQTISLFRPMQVPDDQDSGDWQHILEAALTDDKFVLNFQPIIALNGIKQRFYDTFLGLQLTAGERLNAEVFIRAATQLQMLDKLDKWVIQQVINILCAPNTKAGTRFFIKLSRQSILEPTFTEWLQGQLAANNLSGNNLIFEISEIVAAENLTFCQQVLRQLHLMNCEVALEHFGSGMAFSESLNNLDVNYLKINGDFVQNMAHDPDDLQAVKAIIDMIKQADKFCIAEFVSDASSLALLWRLGVDYAQGYYLQEPLPEPNYNFEALD